MNVWVWAEPAPLVTVLLVGVCVSVAFGPAVVPVATPPVGLAVESVGLWLTGGLDEVAAPARIVLALGLGGFGSGLFLVANMHYVMAALSPTRQGTAGSVVALMRTAGVVLGASLTTAVYAARLSAHAPLGPEGAISSAFTDAFSVAAGIALAAALVSLVPPRARSTSTLPTP